MRIVFRVDASIQMGIGHVMRCLTLADELKNHGCSCLFITRAHPGHPADVILQRGHQVELLPITDKQFQITDANDAHTQWLGATWEKDAEDTIRQIKGTQPDWLIVDHYAIDQRWHKKLRSYVKNIFVIDDLADRMHDCDLLLDQNMVVNMSSRYAGKVPEYCKILLGPEYALLQPIYADLHERIHPREGSIQRILIYFGGADSDNLTGCSISAFLCLNRQDIEVDVVVSSSSAYIEVIRKQIENHANIHLHDFMPTLASLMSKADLTIGAGGATSWERLCLGLPALVVTLAENQRPIAEGLQQYDLVRWLGHKDEVTESDIAQALAELIQRDIAADWSRRCLATVDGKGTVRVCAALTVTASTPLKVRHALLRDEALLLEWANDPEVRRNAFHPERITAEAHHQWFYKRLRDIEGCRLYIVETKEEDVPVGQVRFENNEQRWKISYALAPQFRGRGLGRQVLDVAILQLRRETGSSLFFGEVKADNLPSQRIFESLGFEHYETCGGGGLVYQRVFGCE